jgi:NAD(P)-dependent dehydrogenase (short-subunit alcohol dehydrogenase family)
MNPKHILIVGGMSGIGEKLVQKLLDEGHQLICATRNPQPSTHANISTLCYDAEQPEKLDLPEVLDGVVYCPGSISLKPFQRLSKEDFKKDMQINFYGAVDILQQAQKSLKKSIQASVVLFSTVAAQTGMPFHASIASAKAALEGLTKSLAAEWSPKIRINAIAPSLTDTKLASALLSSEEKRKAAAQRHPLKSIGQPRDIADLASFLLSDSSKFMTGQIIHIDGGMSALQTFN